jgi:hypothetical protein
MRTRNWIVGIVGVLSLLILLSSSAILWNSQLTLKQQVNKDYPQLLHSGLSEWGKVILLRQWAYSHIDTSTKSCLIDQDRGFAFYSKDAQELFQAFAEDRGGVWCYGAAFSLARLYGVYGLDAYVCDMGNPEVMTHAVTLVRIRHGGRTILSVQDPTFDLTYVDAADEPVDYFDLLNVLRRNESGAVKALVGSAPSPDCIVAPQDDPYHGTLWNPYRNPGDRPKKVLAGGRQVFQSRLSLDRFAVMNGAAIKTFLVKEGHPPELIYLYLYPITIQWGSEAASLQDRAKAAVR